MTSKRFLIAGATGFVGSAPTRRLVGQGHGGDQEFHCQAHGLTALHVASAVRDLLEGEA